MVWADRIVGEIKERFAKKIAKGQPLVIRDEKTLSGRVHIGSLRGVVIHGLIAQILEFYDIKNTFQFELNDFDPMDSLPAYVDQKNYRKHMGEPLYRVPSYEIKTQNYPMVFGEEFVDVVNSLKLPIHFYHLRPLYKEGKFNEVIREALDGAVEIRAIYREVSGSVKPDDWYPLQVVCEKCGKIGTTQVTHWDSTAVCHGERSRTMTGIVTYTCKPDLVKWAKGCGHSGNMSPFDGHAKLPWKVEWPAKWKVFGIDIEGCGKDHSAAGGSRDIGRRIVTEIFHYPEPFNIPYEFFNLAGKKMSASKGVGASAKEVSDLLPPELIRLLMIRKLPNHPIDFNPDGDTIPLLFDEYDRLADHAFKRHPKPDHDFTRTFHIANPDFPKKPEDLWQMRFSVLSFVLQMPHLRLEDEAVKLKGSALTDAEKSALRTRARYVEKWLQEHAPEEYRFRIVEQPPPLALDDTQRSAIAKVLSALERCPWDGASIHDAIHAVKAETGIEPKKLFQPLYQAFLGRDNGPQMGWFLSTFEREKVLQHLATLCA